MHYTVYYEEPCERYMTNNRYTLYLLKWNFQCKRMGTVFSPRKREKTTTTKRCTKIDKIYLVKWMVIIVYSIVLSSIQVYCTHKSGRPYTTDRFRLRLVCVRVEFFARFLCTNWLKIVLWRINLQHYCKWEFYLLLLFIFGKINVIHGWWRCLQVVLSSHIFYLFFACYKSF